MLSVVIATHNGAATLPRMLRALAGVRRPPGGVEFIAVDNASDDDTGALLETEERALRMKVLHEPRRGKSFALNRGIEAAAGDLIVFTDDDVLPEAGWLEAFVEAAERRPDAAVFAGQVRHEWDAPPPAWLEALAARGLSYAGTPIDREEGPVEPRQAKGPNIMVRRAALGDIRFSEAPDVNFSGQGTSSGGEDTRFVKEVAEATGIVLFVPNACVRHIVRRHEVGLLPVFQRYVRIGRVQGGRADYHRSVRADLKQIFRDCVALAKGLPRKDGAELAQRMVFLAMSFGRFLANARKRLS